MSDAEDVTPQSRSRGGIASGASSRGPMPGLARSSDTGATAAMREARHQWPTGVAVVLTRSETGYRGATVGAFAVVSLAPPLVLVCLEREGWLAGAIPATGAFAVSVLDRSQEFLADRFAGRAPVPDARLAGIRHHLGDLGLPRLDGALAWFDCRVEAVHPGGDHVVVVGEVVAGARGEDTDDPLLSCGGRYRGLEGA